MLKGILSTVVETKAVYSKEIERVNIHTAVREKAIAFQTDARLYE